MCLTIDDYAMVGGTVAMGVGLDDMDVDWKVVASICAGGTINVAIVFSDQR